MRHEHLVTQHSPDSRRSKLGLFLGGHWMCEGGDSKAEDILCGTPILTQVKTYSWAEPLGTEVMKVTP